jgi:addiction module RelE/StbE family toxin
MGRIVRIEYLPEARLDLLEIFDYIEKDNRIAAEQFIKTMEYAIERLIDFPELGVIPKEVRLQSLGYRMLIVEKYLVFYVIFDDIVEIRRIIHGKRKYSFLL